jgi:transcriptional regulator with XRE-family HTH domain
VLLYVEMSEIGERIKQIRLKRGFSQSELARRAGVTPGLIWQIEVGMKDPGRRALIGLARALSVSLDELIPIDKEEDPNA